MGVAGSVSRWSKTAAVRAKEKRTKIPKPQSKCSGASPDIPKAVKKKRRERKTRHKPLGPGTRPGAHQQLPIIIDSDDGGNSDEAPGEATSLAARAYSLPANRVVSRASSPPADLMPSAYSSSATFLRQSRSRLGFPQRPRPRHPGEQQHLLDGRSSSAETSPCSSFENNLAHQKRHSPAQRRNQRVQSLKAHPHPWQGPSPSNARTRKPGLFANYARTPYSAPSSANHGVELTLAEIPGFDLRKKTAHLMAVAPGLPIADLYHLLSEKGGRLEAAKQELSDRSQIAPTPSSANPIALARASTVPLTKPIYIEDDGRDEPYIKIDLDDPAFMWDNDAPTTPPPETSRRKQNSKAKPNLTPKSFARPTAKHKRPRPTDARSTKTTGKQTAVPTKKLLEPGVARRSKGGDAGDINRGTRETSFDRSFIASDDEIVENSDDTYSDSEDGAASDINMNDDETDLSIDMEPRYAFNANILSTPGSS
ncbi:hypothetical protein M3J09_010349 [Ascochyta lentis]